MTTAAAPSPPTPLDKIRVAAADIKLAHSVFALPFAGLASVMAFAGTGRAWPGFAGMAALVVVCMVAARTFAMLFNRLADRGFDAHNPRTSRRAFAAGALSPRDGAVMLAASAAAFLAAAAAFWPLFGNRWPLAGAPLVLVWLAFYSVTKRFTALCHLALGVALALSPIAAAVAVGGPAGLSPAIWLLAGFVALWVAGFDIIYALADLDFDRAAGLNSVPARLGWRGAAWASRGFHLVAAGLLIGAWLAAPEMQGLFGLGVLATLGLLIAEHAVLARRGRAGLDVAFFTLNGVVSVLLGLLGALDAVV